MEKALATRDRGALADRTRRGRAFPPGAIRSIDEVYAWDQTRSQGLVVEVDHPVLGPIELPGPPLRFDDAPRRRPHRPARPRRRTTTTVLAWLEA